MSEQNEHQLEEIIWEFTLKCDKNCEYCGSKDILNNNNDFYDPIKICKQIISVNPKKVVFSGGEPSIKSIDLVACTRYIKNNSDKNKIIIGVLTNGLFFEKLSQQEQTLFDVVGYSINTKEDMIHAEEMMYNSKISHVERVTMVINIGTHNYDIFKDLISFGIKNFKTIQVQLTMGEFQLELGKINDLREHIRKIISFLETSKDLKMTDDVVVVIGDNLSTYNECPCQAGKKGIGITNNGLVTGCLSERSFTKIIPEGDLSKDSLIDIWKNKFKKYRLVGCTFCPCCKDVTGVDNLNRNYAKHTLSDQHQQQQYPTLLNPPNKPFNNNTVYVYSVFGGGATSSTVTYSDQSTSI